MQNVPGKKSQPTLRDGKGQATTLPLADDLSLVIALRRTRRARRLILSVSAQDGRVRLTVPPSASRHDIDRFLASRLQWVRRVLATIPTPLPVAEGTLLPVEGEPLRLERARIGRVERRGGCLLLPPRGRAGVLVANWLKLFAREKALVSLARCEKRLGRKAAGLRLADPQSRWGSCSASGKIMLSWRLAMAPPAVFDYVVAHEAAHLVEMNHSRAFWAVVAELCPDYAHHRAWLKHHGRNLHRFRFDKELLPEPG